MSFLTSTQENFNILLHINNIDDFAVTRAYWF